MRTYVEEIRQPNGAHAHLEHANWPRLELFGELVPAGSPNSSKHLAALSDILPIVSEGTDYGNLKKTVGKDDGLHAGQA